jgi:hypothetical protein
VHLSNEIHEDRELLDEFLDWLDLQVSGMATQLHLNKNQLQQLLLGIGLLLRDLEFCCFTDTGESPIPSFLVESCMEKEDIEAIATTLNKLFNAVYNDLK